MMMHGSGIVSIGECMVELARADDGRYGLGYGGDTFNTAVYLARCGVPVSYATALGDDPYSEAIRALARAEGVGTELIATKAGRMPGLYLIETTPAGERTFYYWRERSPARELFDGPEAAPAIAAMACARLVYISGITLSLYAATALDRLAGALEAARAAGARVAMDGNFRPRGWGGDRARARRVMERFWRLAHVALPTFDDEALLWGDAAPEATLARLGDLGVAEVVVKLGAEGAVVATQGEASEHVPIPAPVTAIDTSAAGDSFNAAYLAARLEGLGPAAAAAHGHRLAGVVVQYRGAIAPAAATVEVARLIRRGA
jgi:2-dehydro-3-deoxygluconokinase